MVRQTLEILQHLLQDFKVCLIILGHYALKGYEYNNLKSNIRAQLIS